MSKLVSRPLASPILTSFPTLTETGLWSPLTFSPLRNQQRGKTWRLRFSGIATTPTGGAGGADIALNFYYGSLSPSFLLGSAEIPLPSNPEPFIVDAVLQIQDTSLLSLTGVLSSAALGLITPNSGVSAVLFPDSALLVTGLPNSIAQVNSTVTITEMMLEELEVGVPILWQGKEQWPNSQ